MALFGVKTDKSDIVSGFMVESNTRLQIGGRIGRTHEGTIKGIMGYSSAYYIIEMSPIYPPFYLSGFMLIAIGIVLRGGASLWLYIPGVIILSLGTFWTGAFMYLGLFLGLRHAGYKGKVNRLSKSKLLRVVLKYKI